MRLIMSGQADPVMLGEFLIALNEKGPSVAEITGAAQIMRQFSLKVSSKHKKILDTCGTGGDQKNTFNISTLVALIAAAAGVPVAKHGNRSISSQCGSADILEALGVKIDLGPSQLGQCLDEIGIAFLFAQRLHPAMKNVAPIRKALGVKTIFNLLGPLTNPAGATHQMIGVYERKWLEPLAYVLKNLGLKRAFVVSSDDGLDEITTTGISFACEFDDNGFKKYEIDPRQFGFSYVALKAIQGGELSENVRISQEILEGRKGPHRDIVVLNAAYAFRTAEKVKSIEEGLTLASQMLDSGKAQQKLNTLKEWTSRV